ncbi:MAG: ribonuclease domain-containing protein [Ottowia sp.]|uniref:ribonuclease domain-containing protein n=1 Tax=Ottowia sp. TaxID=1898956 RepID=UPI0039E3E4F9
MLRTAASHAARSLLVVSLLVSAGATMGLAHARGPAWGEAEATVVVTELPPQGQRTYALILRGGPFPYDKDGAVFGNRERLLPRERRGYYREYTVDTPGARSRGARRIVCGGWRPRAPEGCWYTGDHYASFKRIVQ